MDNLHYMICYSLTLTSQDGTPSELDEPLSEEDGGMVALLRPNNSQEDTVREEREDSVELPTPPIVYHCGCGPWRPKWLQRIVSPKLFTALLCAFTLIEGTAVSGKCLHSVHGMVRNGD